MPTALQIAQVRQTQFSAGLLSLIPRTHPLFSAFDFRTVNGYSFLSLALKARPDGAAFTQYGQGFESSDPVFELREFSCSLIGGLVKSERITEDRWNRENAVLEWDWFAIVTREKFFQSILNLEIQMIKGTDFDAAGFPGAKELTPFVSGNVITAAENGAKYHHVRAVLNAAGTTSNTASSVYSFVFGERDCQGIIGGGQSSGEFLTMGETITQMLPPDPTNFPNKLSEHHVAQMDGHIGLSVSGFNQQVEGQTVPTQFSVRRIANLTADSTKTLTDKLMTTLSRMHGTGKSPNLFAMSERSGEQLAASRAPVAVNFNMGSGDAAANQANIYPDPPDNWRGVPIVYPSPDVIGDTDAIEAV